MNAVVRKHPQHCCSSERNRVSANAEFRTDPTKTTVLRRRFEEDLERRFDIVKRAIREMVLIENAFGIVRNVGRFEFERDSDKGKAFMRWLKDLQDKEILEIVPGTPLKAVASNAWTNKYIQSAYQKGIANAGARMRSAGAQVSDRWLNGAFNRPIHADRIARIYMRTFKDLDGITKEMDKGIRKTLSLGFAEGRSPLDIARQLNKDVDGIGITRARTLARTEIVAAHADANLSAFEEAGVEGVDVESEWSTASDPCPICDELAGETYTIAEARGLMPAHPNCRCAWTPRIVNGSGIVLR